MVKYIPSESNSRRAKPDSEELAKSISLHFWRWEVCEKRLINNEDTEEKHAATTTHEYSTRCNTDNIEATSFVKMTEKALFKN